MITCRLPSNQSDKLETRPPPHPASLSSPGAPVSSFLLTSARLWHISILHLQLSRASPTAFITQNDPSFPLLLQWHWHIKRHVTGSEAAESFQKSCDVFKFWSLLQFCYSWKCHQMQIFVFNSNNLHWRTCPSSLDVHGLESSIERWRIHDVRVKVPMVLPVHEERHDDGDDQTHDDGDDDTHVQGHIICAGSRWRERQKDRSLEKTDLIGFWAGYRRGIVSDW